MLNNSLSDAILSEKVLSTAAAHNTAFHVAFGVDEHYIKGMGVTILSLIKNNPNIHFMFHVFYNSITPEDLGRLNQLVNENCMTVHLYQINQETFKNFPTFAQFTNAIYNRLLVVNKLKDIADKVLYLDADIVCLADISELFHLNMGDNIVAAVKDAEHAVMKQIKKLNFTNDGYFNSGVIYIDINKWHDNQISEKALKLIVENYDKFTFPDQDALNIVLDNHILFIDQKWNYLFDLDKDTIPSDTILLHYAGRTKPWCNWCIHPVRDHFLKFYRESPWRNIEFDKPTHYKHMKSFAKISRRNGSLLKSIYWYLKYVQARFKL